MPDDDLEKLFAEAVAKPDTSIEKAQFQLDHSPYETDITAQALPQISTDMECKHCGHAARSICPTCSGAFCEAHASPMDKTYCNLCLTEPLLDLKELPLKDADGVTHAGRILVPLEPSYNKLRFGTLSKSISEMSDYELESHIDLYKHLVKQAETLLDTRRVIIGSMQIESAQRGDAKRRTLRADKRKYPVKTVSVGKDGKAKPSLTGLVKLIEMMKALDAQQRAKKAASQTTQEKDGLK